MGPVTGVALALLVGAGALCLVRMISASSAADRMIALETLLVTTVSGIAVFAVRADATHFLTVLVVTSLVGFVGTVTVARFIERRGARQPGPSPRRTARRTTPGGERR